MSYLKISGCHAPPEITYVHPGWSSGYPPNTLDSILLGP